MRWEHSRIEPPHWGDSPVALIGGGASLKGYDLSALSEVHTCAVKGAIFDCPWAEIGFGLDVTQLRVWWTKFRRVSFPVYWAIPERFSDAYYPARADCLRFIHRSPAETLSDDPGIIHGGGSSGFGALNVAYLKRARFVVLFGYDYGAVGGEWHANDAHYNPRHVYVQEDWTRWASAFYKIKEQLRQAGTEVINASPFSNIAAFERVTVEEGLKLCGKR